MHSRTPPLEEARRLYIEQSHLATRLLQTDAASDASPLVIWDVGLGAATNAMAAIQCYETVANTEAETGAHPETNTDAVPAKRRIRPLQIISFENDLDPLRLASKHNREFTYLRHPGPAAILSDAQWKSTQHPGLEWILLPGDFLANLAHAPAPDLIFFDMFSSKTSPDQWTLNAFSKIAEACSGRAVELFTYSCSTPVRAGLLAAGFHLASGCSTGEKVETTIALTPAACAMQAASRRTLLSTAWLERWKRSGAKFPAGVLEHQRPAFELSIVGHAQFRNPTPHAT
jgi:queuine tRNA-ribosyltransferase